MDLSIGHGCCLRCDRVSQISLVLTSDLVNHVVIRDMLLLQKATCEEALRKIVQNCVTYFLPEVLTLVCVSWHQHIFDKEYFFRRLSTTTFSTHVLMAVIGLVELAILSLQSSYFKKFRGAIRELYAICFNTMPEGADKPGSEKEANLDIKCDNKSRESESSDSESSIEESSDDESGKN